MEKFPKYYCFGIQILGDISSGKSKTDITQNQLGDYPFLMASWQQSKAHNMSRSGLIYISSY